MMKKRTLQFLLIAAIAFLYGCSAMQPFPMSARPGDTITLAVGSPDGLTKNNVIDIEFYHDSAPLIPISLLLADRSNLKTVFKLYPEKTSYAWLKGDARLVSIRSGHGPWLSTILLDLPASGIPYGTGKIKVTVDTNVVYPRYAPNINDVDIAFEVLEAVLPDGSPNDGTGNPFEYANFALNPETSPLTDLEGMQRVVVKPPVPAEGASFALYGAIEVKLNIPLINLAGGAVLDEGIRVVMDGQPEHEASQLQRLWKRNGDEITVMLTSPVGMRYYEARFSVLPFADVEGYFYMVNGVPSLVSVTYYDIDGNDVTALTVGYDPEVVAEDLSF